MGEKYCSFIGQRPMLYSWGYDEENDDFLSVRDMMKEKMTELVESGTKSFISDMSLGISLTGAELALELHDELDSDIRLVCVIPFEKQADKWTSEHRERYYSILSRADKTIVLQSEFSENCYKKSGEWVCRYASFIIAVCGDYPNSSAAKRIIYAKKHSLSLYLINSDTLEVSEWIYNRNRLPV